ncbi:MAG: protein translocase SEC61 complex subunit gamma [Candidatus Diapherotrites archaeon]|uniref:Protein translocase subunit SecE n=1 Tax=Candidatus Iainarchaeum sp. TaxID=3101447 RepID=A0A2D6LPK0_9ARCH|nr:protein translocase SEC61 complex subunit gamma [Candidatus Diapherotrites archaeon]|tara:strand:- start:1340 stop:1513 length:174 start_codon:yes stop_codon:yes gene_type:complete
MVDVDAFIQSSTRIFNVSRKPDMQEYRVMSQITGLGIILIGVIGFFVKLILEGFIQL